MQLNAMAALGSCALACMLAAPLFAADKPAAKSKWPAENLSGSVVAVNPDTHLLIVKGPEGVPFDMRVTDQTRIDKNNAPVKLDDLKTGASVSIHFVPERKGDVAESVQVSS